MAGAIVIVRKNRLADFGLHYKVVIDKKRVGDLLNGETGTYPVAPGTHAVEVRLERGSIRSKTVTVTVVEAGSVTLKCGPRGGRLSQYAGKVRVSPVRIWLHEARWFGAVWFGAR